MGEEPMEHEDCPRNYLTGSSKAMEASAALEIVSDLHKKEVLVENIVSDDDSTMRAHLKHEDTAKNAKLPKDVHQPIFLCDPSHRIKVMVKDFFALALMSDSKSECKKIDALRLKKYFGCWIGKSKLLQFEKFKELSKAPVEHLFGCHEWCSADWCFSADVDKSRECIVTTVSPTLLPTATIADVAQIPLGASVEVINPTICHPCTNLAATAAPSLPMLPLTVTRSKVDHPSRL